MTTASSKSAALDFRVTLHQEELDLYLPTLKVISHRGPGDTSGVPTSLESIVKRLQTKVHWFALEGHPATAKVNAPNFKFYAPKIPAPLLDEYKQFCSEYLWPLFHGYEHRAQFDPEGWKSFKTLNTLVASEVLSVSADSIPTLCWLHDYHLALIPSLVAINAGVILCQFWHVAWPQAELIASSPIGRELVDSLLHNRVLGFHTIEFARNFLETARIFFPTATIESERLEIRRGTLYTKLVAMTLGVDLTLWENLARKSEGEAKALRQHLQSRGELILSVDRLDYTKGVIEKLQGIRELLKQSPAWAKRFQYVQIAYPQMHESVSSETYAEEVRALVCEINEQFGNEDWQPIQLLEGFLDRSELAAWYQNADVLSVNPIKAGCNLIAKEYVATRLDGSGVLILSNQSGCASELGGGAILVDGTKISELARAFARALEMSESEKDTHMKLMRNALLANQLQDWAVNFLRTTVNASPKQAQSFAPPTEL